MEMIHHYDSHNVAYAFEENLPVGHLDWSGLEGFLRWWVVAVVAVMLLDLEQQDQPIALHLEDVGENDSVY